MKPLAHCVDAKNAVDLMRYYFMPKTHSVGNQRRRPLNRVPYENDADVRLRFCDVGFRPHVSSMLRRVS